MLRTFWRFRRIVRPYAAPLAVGGALVLVVAATDILAPWPLKVVVDNVLREQPLTGPIGDLFHSIAGDGREEILAAAVIAFVAIVVVNAMSDYLSSYVLDAIGQRVMADLRTAVFTHLQRQSLQFHDRQRVGDLMTRITSDVVEVQNMLVTSLSVLIPNVTVLTGIVIVMFVVDPAFALLALAISPVLFLLIFTFTRRIKRASKIARRKESEIASVASEALTAIRVVQAYTTEQRHEARFQEHNAERLAAGLDAVRLQSKLSPAIDVVTAVGTALVLWFGAHRVMNGEMSLGLLLVFLAYLSQLYRPMRSLSKLAWVVSRGQASADRLQEVLSVDARVVERPDARIAPKLVGAVRFEGVTFGYDAGRRDRRARGRDRGGQVDAREPNPAVPRRVGRHRPRGRRGRALVPPEEPPAPDRTRSAGLDPVPRFDLREHRVRRRARHGGGRARRSAGGLRRRVRGRPSGRVRHGGLRARHHALRRPAAADRDRARPRP